MPRHACPSCAVKFSFKEVIAGKMVACPRCKEMMRLPEELLEVVAVVEEPPPPRPKQVPAKTKAELLHNSCIGCGRVLRNFLRCHECKRAFCSEVCLNRHVKLTGHSIAAGCGLTAGALFGAAVVVVVGFFVFCGVIGRRSSNNQQPAEIGQAATPVKKPAIPVEEPTEDVRERMNKEVKAMSSSQILSLYRLNEVAADEAFKDKWVKVTGTIMQIGKDILGQPYVLFKKDDDSSFAHVQCVFDKDHSNELAKLAPFKTTTILGVCHGKTMNVLLFHCSVSGDATSR